MHWICLHGPGRGKAPPLLSQPDENHLIEFQRRLRGVFPFLAPVSKGQPTAGSLLGSANNYERFLRVIRRDGGFLPQVVDQDLISGSTPCFSPVAFYDATKRFIITKLTSPIVNFCRCSCGSAKMASPRCS
jgi:hypothetical protein